MGRPHRGPVAVSLPVVTALCAVCFVGGYFVPRSGNGQVCRSHLPMSPCDSSELCQAVRYVSPIRKS